MKTFGIGLALVVVLLVGGAFLLQWQRGIDRWEAEAKSRGERILSQIKKAEAAYRLTDWKYEDMGLEPPFRLEVQILDSEKTGIEMHLRDVPTGADPSALKAAHAIASDRLGEFKRDPRSKKKP